MVDKISRLVTTTHFYPLIITFVVLIEFLVYKESYDHYQRTLVFNINVLKTCFLITVGHNEETIEVRNRHRLCINK